jgi:hypothetical protein
MKTQSFHDILLEKLSAPKEVEAEVIPDSSSRLDLPLADFSPFFKVFVNVSPQNGVKAYPRSALKVEVPLPRQPIDIPVPVDQKLVFVEKENLSEEEQQVWGLFEKMVGQNFHGKMNRSIAMKAFRTFIKKIHPDTAQKKSDHNFATLIKIKNELISVIEKNT